ncbi:hypothetical protein NKI50_14595, partial [Mesorhizobium sp. M0563]|uniref:hypothetical protein n=1 Tax=Mesorhizobium sp. M0563 TaxID=2956959 RepID=UPI00333A2A54
AAALGGYKKKPSLFLTNHTRGACPARFFVVTVLRRLPSWRAGENLPHRRIDVYANVNICYLDRNVGPSAILIC